MSALPNSAPLTYRRRIASPEPTTLIATPKPPLPISVQVLMRFQQVTSCITLGMVATVLGVYGWTVYTPTLWSKEYQELKALQQTERQLITNTEAIKNQLAREADRPGSGLVNPSPGQNLFLPAKAREQTPEQDNSAVASIQNFNIAARPVAY